ncbi:hypothetical protein M9Y10_021178 [Tritrichomonas musculus]|uniref:Uncharacterized protein n=1 Tax=Tritrichomonas musculus TaxID=1915356 RepID=A0ABR2HD71_9EUKA
MSKTADPTAGISSIIQQIQQQKKLVEEDYQRTKQLVSIQDELIKKQRDTLLQIQQTSNELQQVEEKRDSLKQQLATQKSKLLVAASESTDLTNLINDTIAQDNPQIANTSSGSAALKAIESIQNSVFSLTEECMKSENFTVSADGMDQLIVNVNKLIQDAIKDGSVKETTEDTIRRQSFVISSLVSPQPEDEQ